MKPKAKTIRPEYKGISLRTAIPRYWFTNSNVHMQRSFVTLQTPKKNYY